MKKITDFLFSTRFTGFLILAFAIAMITGTFLDANEETSPTPLTRNVIYHAFWFKAIMVLMAVNFIGNIKKYRLLRKEKWPVLLFHLAFILVILGAGITHYYGFEGMMSIREGQTQNKFLSAKTYITTYVDGDYVVNGQAQRRVLESEVDFSFAVHGIGRFRGNAFRQRGSVAIVLRQIPTIVPTFQELQLPKVMMKFAQLSRGLVLVCGPTGSGKSTTLAAEIEHVNVDRPEHIVTNEDPIEFLYKNKKSSEGSYISR